MSALESRANLERQIRLLRLENKELQESVRHQTYLKLCNELGEYKKLAVTLEDNNFNLLTELKKYKQLVGDVEI